MWATARSVLGILIYAGGIDTGLCMAHNSRALFNMEVVVKLKQHPSMTNVFVSPDGRIFYELPQNTGYGGYRTLHVPGKNTLRAHTVICEAYHGERPAGAVVRHLDGVSTNDHADNLAWGTQQENCDDTVRHGKSTKGSKNPQAVLTRRKVLDIRRRRVAGESNAALAAEYGVSPATICDIVKRRTWK